MNQGWIYRERVKLANAGLTVLAYYSSKYQHSDPETWAERIRTGQILVNQQSVTSQTVLNSGDQLEYHREPWIEPEVPLELEILYQDLDLLIINKPSGLPVMPGGGFLEHTLVRQLKLRFPQAPPKPVHRLGRGTSGLMILGRSPAARSKLSAQMRDSTKQVSPGAIEKIYLALVTNQPSPENFTITQPIGQIPHPGLGSVHGATEQGKTAHSECQVIKHYAEFSLVRVKITTGRPHQIRIHLAAVGYPLLGDPLYAAGGELILHNPQTNRPPVPGDCGYYLHAHRLRLIHPITHESMSFECSFPVNWPI